MPTKKPKASSKKRAKVTARKVAGKAKKAAKKTTKKVVAKKGAKKRAVRKPVAKKTGKKKVVGKKIAKPVKVAVKKKVARAASARPAAAPSIKRAAKPKLPRRTTQAAPPTIRVSRPPVVDVTPVTPPSPPTSLFSDTGPTGTTPSPAAPPVVLNVGDMAPGFALPDQNGKTHWLSQYHGQTLVLYFYPKDDTPGCTTEACGFRNRLGEFTDRNAVVLGVSPDSAESHEHFAQKYGLPFPLLVDDGHSVAERYGVWVEKGRVGAVSMGIARTTFVIDGDGKIAHVFRDVRPEGHDQEVLNKLAP